MIWYFDDEGAGNEFRVYSLLRVGYVLRLDPVVRTEKGAKCGHSDVRIKTYKHKQQQIIKIFFSFNINKELLYHKVNSRSFISSQVHSRPIEVIQG